MEHNYTPGPWTICTHFDEGDQAVYIDCHEMRHGHSKNITAVVPQCHCEVGWKEAFGNAALISASPDLLAAVEALLRDYASVYGDGDRRMKPAIAQAQAALEKALSPCMDRQI